MKQSCSARIAQRSAGWLLKIARQGYHWGLIGTAAWLTATAKREMCCMSKLALPAAPLPPGLETDSHSQWTDYVYFCSVLLEKDLAETCLIDTCIEVQQCAATCCFCCRV